ncbi:MAG: endopeptidase La [Kiritimatiellia bacterium]
MADHDLDDIEVVKTPDSKREPKPEDRLMVPARAMFPKVLPILPLPNRPIFPGMVVPLAVDEHYQPLIREIVESRSKFVGLILVRNKEPGELPRSAKASDMFEIGTIAEIAQLVRPEEEAPLQVVVAALGRFKLEKVVTEQPFVRAEVRHITEPDMDNNNELKAYAQSILSSLKELLNLNPLFKEELRLFLSHSSLNDPGRLADFAAALTTADGKELQHILETVSIRERIEKSLSLLTRELDISKLKVHINKQIEEKLSKQQREFFLREQLKMIKKELGIEKEGKETELDRFRKRLETLTLSEEARKRVDEEMEKLGVMEPASPEYSVTRNYLDWITSLPWGQESKDSLDIKKARETLDANHYGLDDIKDRILEFLSVGILKGRIAGSIICLVGPPGVGKTSIGQAIAQSVGRKFYRFSLGGMRDEAEISGHRRTYIGAMPGKFIQALKVCGTRNPVIMLDEVDKIGASFQGDPASALLEVLDPEQNRDFLDHYLDVRFDLSQVLFVCTANQSDTIPLPLLDRMEIINLSGYILEEKLQIAKRHIIPRQLKENGLTPAKMVITDGALREIIDGYARDPGVRSLENGIRKIYRKVAKNIVTGATRKTVIDERRVVEFMGKRVFTDTDPFKRKPGIVMGLAWTSLGGTTMYVEATAVPSKSPGFKQTGQLGKVMVESSEIALSVVRGKLGALEQYKSFFENNIVHLHVPAGATPKDGPSAGITMACALYSMVSGKKLRKRLAMTGELSLTGLVMPIGGLKEKTIAARRAGVKMLIFPSENKKDFDELPQHIRRGLDPHFVGTFDEVIALCF